MDFIIRLAEEFLKKHKRLARYRRVFALLAAVVVFATTYELILPAITMDRKRAAATPGVEVGVASESFGDLETSGDPFGESSVSEGTMGAEFPAEEDASMWEASDPFGGTTGDGTNVFGESNASDANIFDGQQTDAAEGGQNSDGGENAGDGANAFDEGNASDGNIFDGQESDPASGREGSESDGSGSEGSDAASGRDASSSDGADGLEGADGLDGLDSSDTASDASSEGYDDHNENDVVENGEKSAESGAGNTLNADTAETGVSGSDRSDSLDADQSAFDAVSSDPGGETDDNAGFGSSGSLDQGANTGSGSEASDADPAADSNAAGAMTGSTAGAAAAGATGQAALGSTDASAIAATDGERTWPATLTYEGKDYTVTATFDEKAALPADVTLQAVEILPDTEYKDENGDPLYPGYEEYYEKTLAALEKEKRLADDQTVSTARFFDITFLDKEGTAVEPKAPVSIAVQYKDALPAAETVDTMAVHFDVDEKKDRTEVEVIETQTQVETVKDKKTKEEKEEISRISFDAEKFSVYGVIGTQVITADFLTADGETLKVTVTFDKEEEVPKGAVLEVKEIQEKDEGWIDRSVRLADTLYRNYGDVILSDARFLSIKIFLEGKEYQPALPVQVKIDYVQPINTKKTKKEISFAGEIEEEYIQENQPNRFVLVHYEDDNGAGDKRKEEASFLDANTIRKDDAIIESSVSTPGFSDYDIAYLYEYDAPKAELDYLSAGGTRTAEQVVAAASRSNEGKPLLRALANDGSPDHEKTLTDNRNGTYTIGLNVTGDADTTQKASNVNVVIVYDVSSSMTIYNVPSATGQFGRVSSSVTDYNNDQLYRKSGTRYVTISDSDNYSGTVYYRNGYGSNYTEYHGQRYANNARANLGEKALYDFTHALYGYKDPSNPTNIQTALVTFAGSATRVQNWTSTETDITNRIKHDGVSHSLNYTHGTNWEAALQMAETVVATADDDPTYVVFITDGAPTSSVGKSWTSNLVHYQDALDEALAIKQTVGASNGDFFGIYAYGEEADYLASLIYYANNGRRPSGGDEGTTFDTPGYYNASNTEDLNRAIGEIFQKIVQTLGISGVSIQDGTTSHVETSTGTAHLLVVENSYQYWLSIPVVPGTGETYTFTMPDKVSGENITYTVTPDGDNVTIAWDGGSVTCPGTVNLNTLTIEWTQANSFYNYAPPAASYSSETGAVNWNLRGLGTLLDGVTYTVTFDCYPSQETLDLIADLKNGYVQYGDLDSEIRKYLTPDGDDYVLATNTEATLTYTDTRTDQGEQNKTYDNPDPVPSPATEEVAITKDWSNLVDDRGKPDSLTMHVTRDGVDRYEMILNDGDSWTDSAWISFGILTEDADGSNISIKTTGHDYSFSEPADMTYYWELVIPTLRPMLINANPTILEKIESSDAPEMEGDNAKVTVDGITYYKLTIGGTTEYFKVDPYAPTLELKAENYRRSQLDVSKTVSGGNVPEDAEFTFKASVVNSHASSGSEADPNSDYYIWFSIFSEEGLVIDEEDGDLVSGTGLVRERNSSDEYTGYYYIPSGNLITVKMKDGYNLRFLNLPTGTSYLISESNEMPDDSYSFDGISGIRKYTETVVNPETEEETTVEKTEEAGEVDGQAISGTVDKTNSTYKVNVTNKYETTDVQLKKVREDGSTPLDGAVFDLTVWLDGAWSSVQEDISPGSVNSPDGDQTQEEDASSGNSDPAGDDESAAGESGNPFDLGGLGAGWYRLTEEHTPSGYIIKNKDIYFEIYKDNEEFLIRLTDKDQHVIQTLEGVTITKSTGQDGTVTWMITVVNTPGERLPMTGGSGKPPYILSGILLAMASALIYVFRMRQRERRSY